MVKFPLDKANDNMPVFSLNQEDEEIETKDGKQYPVLVIDDDKWVQRITGALLNSWGFTAISASDPIEGIALALEHEPILIILDIILPDIRGDMVLKMLKRFKQTSKIPIIILSGNLNRTLLGNTYKTGATGFITKPFTKATLLEKIYEVIPEEIISDLALKNNDESPSV